MADDFCRSPAKQSTQTSEQEQGATAEDVRWLEERATVRDRWAEGYRATAERLRHSTSYRWETDRRNAEMHEEAAARYRRIAATVRAALG